MSSRVIEALSECPLYFILDGSLCNDAEPVEVGRQALAAGVRLLQLRLKGRTDQELAAVARELKALPVRPGWLLIVNDSVAAALASEADGVHLGQDDLPPAEARRIGPQLVIGATARTPEAAMAAEAAGADYLGCGSVYPSSTKPGLPVIGTAGIAEISRSVGLPVAAIGGIDSSNAGDVLAAGAAGFCSVAPFAGSSDIGQTVAELLSAIGVDKPGETDEA
ncbi:MAG TPA: thiamine phosphate synthase [Firmicutes bacterium]|nr:thiamine phosphate synthase [Bacillota bacterium]